MHNELKIAHRDLKPENIMYKSDGDKVKIGDFTVALEIPHDDFVIKDQEGTKAFEAPEVSMLSEYKPRPLDIWAYGVTLYCFIMQKLPFSGTTDYEINKSIQKAKPYIPSDFSPELQELLRAIF